MKNMKTAVQCAEQFDLQLFILFMFFMVMERCGSPALIQ